MVSSIELLRGPQLTQISLRVALSKHLLKFGLHDRVILKEVQNINYCN